MNNGEFKYLLMSEFYSMYKFRKARVNDIGRCVYIRANTREDALTERELYEMGITKESWEAAIQNNQCVGYVCTVDSLVVGYCFGNVSTGEVQVLAILPEYEGRGIAKKLLTSVCHTLQISGWSRVWLGASPDSSMRAYGFYRHLGWVFSGEFDSHGDEILVRELEIT